MTPEIDRCCLRHWLGVAENEIPGWQILKQMIDIEDGPSTAGDALPEGHRLEELRVYILSNL
tara:strand:+ start:194 stop:379 length:186 start_codon:yes stop_codon:yes gene_type:complete